MLRQKNQINFIKECHATHASINFETAQASDWNLDCHFLSVHSNNWVMGDFLIYLKKLFNISFWNEIRFLVLLQQNHF